MKFTFKTFKIKKATRNKSIFTLKLFVIRRQAILSLIFLLSSLKVLAAQNFTIQGRLLASNGTTPITSNQVVFRVQIKSPGTSSCLLYEETQTLDLSRSQGAFALTVGQGTRSAPTVDGGNSLDVIFSNSSVISLASAVSPCANADTSYQPALSDTRLLILSFNDGTGWDTAQAIPLSWAPQAIFAQNAEKLGGKAASQFLSVVTGVNPVPLSASDYSQLTSLIAGTNGSYVLRSDVPVCPAGQYLVGGSGGTLTCAPLAGLSGGTVTSVSSANSYISVASGTTTPVLTLNVGTTAGTVAAGNDARFASSLQVGANAGGDLTGTYPNPNLGSGAVTADKIANNTITNTQISSSAAISDTKLAAISTPGKVSGNAITSGQLGGTVSVNTSGQIVTTSSIQGSTLSANSITARDLQMFDSGTNRITLQAPASLAANYSFTLPTALPLSDGQVLASSTAGVLSWSSLSGGTVTNVTGTAPISVSNGSSTPVISVGSATTGASGVVTLAADGGTTASTVVQATDSRLTNARTPVGTALTSSQVWVGNASNVAAARNLNITDIKSTVSGNWLTTTGACASGESLSYSAVTDSLTCQAYALTSSQVTTAIGYTPANGTNYVAKAGDTMTGTLNLPNNGLAVGTNQLVVSGGNIGIGTASPTQPLSVLGSAVFSSSNANSFITVTSSDGSVEISRASGGAYIDFKDVGFDDYDARISNTTNGLNFFTGGNGSASNRLRIDSVGNVGIGTTSPSARLSVENGSAFLRVTPGWNASGAGTWIDLDTTGPSGIGSGGPGSNAWIAYVGFVNQWFLGSTVGDIAYRNTSGRLHFGTSAGAPTMTVATSGNVGIGTTSPGTKLDVSGTIKIADGGEACSAAGNGGMIRYSSGNLQFCNGSSWQTLGVSGTGLTSLNGQTGSAQTFAVGSAGTAPAFASASNTHTLNIPLASGAGVTSGTISKVDYDAFTAKLGITSTFGGDVSGTSGTISVDRLKGTALSATAPTSGQVLKYNGTSWAPAADNAGAGSVTSITAGTGLNGGTITASGTINVDVGTTANKIVQLDAAAKLPAVDGSALTSLNASNLSSGTLPVARLPAFTGDVTSSAGSSSLTLSTVPATKGGTGLTALGTANQVLGVNSAGTSAEYKTITAGSGVSIAHGASSITINATGSGGTVTSVTGAAPISVATGTSTPVISIATANTTTTGALSSTDWNTFNNKLSSVSGSSLTSGQVWVGNGSNQAAARSLNISDLKSTVSGNWFTASGACASGESLSYSAVTDSVSCQALSLTSSQVTTALGYTPANGSSYVAKAGDTMTGALNLPSDGLVVGSTQIVATGGRVGIGTSSPVGTLDVTASGTTDIMIRSFGSGRPGISGVKAGGTEDAPTSTAAGSILLFFGGRGYGTTGFSANSTGAIIIRSSQTFTDTAQGTNIGFETTPSGSTVRAERMRISPDGLVGIGTISPTEKLHVVGNLRVQGSTDCTLGNGSGGTSCSSDIRLKENVQEIDKSLEKILSLRGVEFAWNQKSQSPGDHAIGVIAQDVEKVFPTAVIDDPGSGYKKVDYAVLVAPVIQAFKELNKRITELFSASERHSREIASVKAQAESEKAAKDKEIAQLKANDKAKDQKIKELEQRDAETKTRLDKIEKMLKSK